VAGTASSLDVAAVGIAPRTRQLLGDYVELTKPKVQSLLLLTTVTTMLVAGSPSIELIVATCIGGYLSAGGAGAVNHWFDRDIDAQMARTATRPVPSGRIAPYAALTFGCVLAALSLLELSLLVNPLAAALSFSGFVGGESYRSLKLMRERHPEFIIEHAVKGMLPKNRLAAKMLTKLKVFKGPTHTHEAQAPEKIKL